MGRTAARFLGLGLVVLLLGSGAAACSSDDSPSEAAAPTATRHPGLDDGFCADVHIYLGLERDRDNYVDLPPQSRQRWETFRVDELGYVRHPLQRLGLEELLAALDVLEQHGVDLASPLGPARSQAMETFTDFVAVQCPNVPLHGLDQ